MRLFISISYNGRAFSGWQKQKNGPSIQEHLEDAFSVYLREKIKIIGAGRTDSGVHAINYIAHLDSNNQAFLTELHTTVYKINAILPPSIVLNHIYRVNDNAHARFDAQNRTYQYFVHSTKDPFSANFSYFYPYNLEVAAMNQAAQLLLGQQDFTSMAKLHSPTKTNICTVNQAIWQPGSPLSAPLSQFCTSHNPPYASLSPPCTPLSPPCTSFNQSVVFTITANRFLRNMVRAVVGTLLEVGRGKQEPEWILSVLQKKERSAAGSSVPPHALFLTNIEYPSKITDPTAANNQTGDKG